jgi:ferredoxin-thioredoxin reductase catalytic subunit
MKIHVTDNNELKNLIRQGLKNNDGYCPCIMNSRGKEEYKCMCEDFRINTPVGQSCHCELYIKDEM